MLENDNLSDYIKEEIYSIKDIDLSKKAEQFNLSIIDVENKIIEYVKELISENTFKSINLANELLTKVKNLDISELQKKLSLKLKNNEEIRNNAIFTAVTELQSFPEYDINIEAINILKSEFKKVWEKRMLTDINNIESLNALDQKIKDIQIKIEELNKGYQPYERSVCFGVFENELIEWKCLRISGDKALLIAQKPIVSKKYDERLNDWKYSSIREWLNNEFINGSFNNNEIEKMNVSPLGDRINLLSIEDALEYFKDPNDRNVGQWYWLSNKGYRKNRIAMVNEHGEINFFGDKIDCLDGIRPVICIDLK